MKNIRNFSITAHIDHGKSTLADRLIQYAGLVSKREFRDQILDNMDIERERGITIKNQSVSIPYRRDHGETYVLNFIDTPGHVDFSYEVSRALAACEGILLLVDATQGVEAQTVANLYAALEHDLDVIPVINKIDSPRANIDLTRREIESELGLDAEGAVLCSAKEGKGIDDILDAIVERISPPRGEPNSPLSALIFDAHYDHFRGSVISCRLFDGSVREGDSIILMSRKRSHQVEEVGAFRIRREKKEELRAGDVGYIIAGIKTLNDTRIGDTITLKSNPVDRPLPGFKEVKPMVFSSIFPVDSGESNALADALERYKLNDASLVYQKDHSAALGPGFRCGFLGLLHLEVFQERLDREFEQHIIMTEPGVEYRFTLTDGTEIMVESPDRYPHPSSIAESQEPFVEASVLTPESYLGPVMEMCHARRGINSSHHYHSSGRMELNIRMPLSEIIFDFYDRLKSVTRGYGSFDYEFAGYRKSDLVKVDILVNREKVDALSFICHRSRARPRALELCSRLRREIPRHMFRIPIQGAIGNQVIAREDIPAFRKDVTGKCYGGDITRKRKLLENQAEGKKRMRTVSNVSIPQSAFISVLNTGEKR